MYMKKHTYTSNNSYTRKTSQMKCTSVIDYNAFIFLCHMSKSFRMFNTLKIKLSISLKKLTVSNSKLFQTTVTDYMYIYQHELP